jgi:hypothetical protein
VTRLPVPDFALDDLFEFAFAAPMWYYLNTKSGFWRLGDTRCCCVPVSLPHRLDSSIGLKQRGQATRIGDS